MFHSVKEPSKKHDIWVRVLFGSLRGSVRFGSGSCTFIFTFGFGLGSVQNWVLVPFVLAGFGFFPSSNYCLTSGRIVSNHSPTKMTLSQDY